jgi:Flp pilus assembly secretin CpaC
MTRKSLLILSALYIGSSSLSLCFGQVSKISAAAVVKPLVAEEVATSEVDKMQHVTVGRTLFLNSQKPLTQVYVDNPLVLGSYAASPSQVVISGLTPGVATVVLWDKDLHHTAYTITVDRNIEKLQEAFENQFPLAVAGNPEGLAAERRM